MQGPRPWSHHVWPDQIQTNAMLIAYRSCWWWWWSQSRSSTSSYHHVWLDKMQASAMTIGKSSRNRKKLAAFQQLTIFDFWHEQNIFFCKKYLFLSRVFFPMKGGSMKVRKRWAEDDEIHSQVGRRRRQERRKSFCQSNGSQIPIPPIPPKLVQEVSALHLQL